VKGFIRVFAASLPRDPSLSTPHEGSMSLSHFDFLFFITCRTGFEYDDLKGVPLIHIAFEADPPFTILNPRAEEISSSPPPPPPPPPPPFFLLLLFCHLWGSPFPSCDPESCQLYGHMTRLFLHNFQVLISAGSFAALRTFRNHRFGHSFAPSRDNFTYGVRCRDLLGRGTVLAGLL